MNISTNIGVWIAALCTIGLLTFFYKDNAWYKLVEYLYVGAAAGHAITLGWVNINDLGIKPLTSGKIIYVLPMVLGLLLYTRFSKSQAWIARIPMGFLIGIGTGMAIRGTIGSQIVEQIRATLIAPNSINNIVIIVGVLTTMSYFFFSLEHKGALGSSARLGRLIMMVTFGAAFGNTVMGRMSLLIARLQYIWGNWLGLIKV